VSERDPFDGPREDISKPGAGRHRAPAGPRERVLSRVVAPITAVAAVAALIVVFIVVRGHSAGSGPGPGVVSAPTGVHSSASSASPTASSGPLPTHPAPTPQLRRSRPPASRSAMAPVRVFNNTRISGLAHHVASEIAQRGWTVPVVGNVTGSTPVTTLYYSPSDRDAARHLAREFSGIRAVRPNSALHLRYHGLTLVLTADWHD
jgi:hypothetical protein